MVICLYMMNVMAKYAGTRWAYGSSIPIWNGRNGVLLAVCMTDWCYIYVTSSCCVHDWLVLHLCYMFLLCAWLTGATSMLQMTCRWDARSFAPSDTSLMASAPQPSPSQMLCALDIACPSGICHGMQNSSKYGREPRSWSGDVWMTWCDASASD